MRAGEHMQRLVSLLMVVTLAGCQSGPARVQSSPAHTPPAVQAAPAPQHRALAAAPSPSVTVDCEGGVGCNFLRVDGVDVPPLASPTPAAALHYQDQGREPVSLRRRVTLTPGLHELKLDFYPLQPDRAEQFKLIHRFESGQPYRLRQYFQRVDRRSASVLEQAQPDPLCIDLLQGEQLARRFCRPHDARSGLGEFVEKKP